MPAAIHPGFRDRTHEMITRHLTSHGFTGRVDIDVARGSVGIVPGAPSEIIATVTRNPDSAPWTPEVQHWLRLTLALLPGRPRVSGRADDPSRYTVTWAQS